MARSRLILPTLEDYQVDPQSRAWCGGACYAHYLYLRPGLVAHVNRRRLKAALQLAEPWLGGDAMDFGCGDGVLLPSLARQFRHVTAVDNDGAAIDLARGLARRMGLDNVSVVHNADGAVTQAAGDRRFDVIFCLETLEHVGVREDLYGSKMALLTELVMLLKPGGAVVVSVPKMTGPMFLLKYLAQWALRRHHEHLTLGELLRAGLLRDTEALEPRWSGKHVGFNERKLRRAIEGRFRIVATRSLGATVMWLVQPRSKSE